MGKNGRSKPDFDTYVLWGLIFGLFFGIITDNIGLGVALGVLVASVCYSYKVKGNLGHRSRKLSRSRDDQMIAGVCGGIARYYEVKPSLVRIAYVIFTFVTGIWLGGLLYLILLILMQDKG